ncbi:hypothetical protein AC249_AIPGENE8173 [Exaiptasia diaphana]|nr:hypothetical protein AC249_AIPGENE8173 [Exaiptasia diaphana]
MQVGLKSLIYLSNAIPERCSIVEKAMNLLLKSSAMSSHWSLVTATDINRGMTKNPAKKSEHAKLANEKFVDVCK